MKPALSPFATTALVVAMHGNAGAGIITKADNTTALGTGASWIGESVPGSGDVADWSGTYNTAGSLGAVLPGSALSWQGISIGTISGTAAGLVSIGGTGTATTGSSLTIGISGIDMSAANQSLVLNSATTVISGNQTWNIAASRNLRLGTTGTGSGNANLDGSGTITISGSGVVDANQGGVSGFSDAAGFAGFSGKWVVNSGATLRGLRNGATAWGSSTASDAITLSGGTLAVGGISGTQGNWTWNTPITLTAATTSSIDQQIFTGTGRSLKLMGAISGSGNLVFKETGATDSFSSNDLGFIIAVDNPSLTGTVTIGGPTENGIAGRMSSVRIGGVNGATDITTGVGSAGTLGTADIVNNGVLTLSRNNTWTFGNNVSGSGILRIGISTGSATHTVTVSGNNSHSGGTTLQSAVTLNIGHANALGSGPFTIAGNGIFDNLTGSPLVVTNALTMSGGSPTFTGTGEMTINGTTTISGANRTITVNASTLTLAGNITEDAALRNLSKDGAGTLVLAGTDSHTGNTTVNAGTLVAGSTASLSGFSTAGKVVVNNGGTLAVKVGGVGQWTAANIDTLRTNANFNTTSSLGLDTTGGDFTYASDIGNTTNVAGTLGITKLGSGTLTLSGNNSYSGNTTVSNGLLVVGSSTALGGGNSAVTVSNSAILRLDVSTTAKSLANSGADTGAIVNLNGNTLTLSAANGTNSFYYGKIDGSGSVLLRGGSDSIQNEGTGAQQTSANFLILGNHTSAATKFALDTGTSTTDRRDFGWINDTGTVLTLSSLTGHGAIRSDAGTPAGGLRFITVDQTADTTFNGSLLSHTSGTGAVRGLTLTKAGAGSLTLAGFIGKQTASAGVAASPVNLVVQGGTLNITNANNTNTANTAAKNTTGTVTVSGGVLTFSTDALPPNSSANSVVMDGGTLRWNSGNTQDVSARIRINDGVTATFDTNGNDVSFGTALNTGGAATGGLAKEGSGSLILAGNNTYTGATVVNAGTLLVNGGLASSSVAVNAGTLGGTGSITGSVTVAIGAGLAPGASIESLDVATATIAGTLFVEYDGTGAGSIDLLGVSGLLDITGATVDFSMVSGGTALNDPVYVFATYGSLSGLTFAGVNNLPAGYTIDYTYGGNSIALIPEPRAALVGGLGLLLLLRRRRLG